MDVLWAHTGAIGCIVLENAVLLAACNTNTIWTLDSLPSAAQELNLHHQLDCSYIGHEWNSIELYITIPAYILQKRQ